MGASWDVVGAIPAMEFALPNFMMVPIPAANGL